jgi:hypothetical protein
MRRLGLLLTAILLLLSCRNPLHEPDRDLSTVRIRPAIPGSDGRRTVTADFSTQFDTLTVSLHHDDYEAPAAKTVSNTTTQVAFTVPAGTWNITVVAMRGTVEVGRGVKAVQLDGGSTPEVDVPIVFGIPSGKGGVSFTVSVSETTGVNYVQGRLVEEPKTVIGASLATADGKSTGTLEFSGLDAGTYSLVLTFRRGENGPVAGIFMEKVVVTAGFTSGSWVGAGGNLVGEREFDVGEFYSVDAALGSLTITVNDSDIFPTSTVDFDPTRLSYILEPIDNLTETVSFTATASSSGQYLEYAFNDTSFSDSSFIDIKSGESVTLTGVSPDTPNTLAVRVTAADRATKNIYWIYFRTPSSAAGGTYAVSGGEGTVAFSVSDGKISIGKCSGSPTAVDIPSSIGGLPVTALDADAFRDCTKLQSVTIPDTVKTMGQYAFCGCTGLTSVKLPSNVDFTCMTLALFCDCENLTSIVIPSSVTTLDGYTFNNCAALSEITIPNSVTYIGGQAFSGCDNLTSVTIPDSVLTLGRSAFHGSGLKEVTIGKSVSSIGLWAFYNCTELSKVHVLGTDTPPTLGDDPFGNNADGRKFYVPAAVETMYETATGWSNFGVDAIVGE